MTRTAQERQDLNRLHYLYVRMLAVQINHFTTTAFSLGLSIEVRVPEFRNTLSLFQCIIPKAILQHHPQSNPSPARWHRQFLPVLLY